MLTMSGSFLTSGLAPQADIGTSSIISLARLGTRNLLVRPLASAVAVAMYFE